VPVAETDFKATLALPKTDFPMRGNLPKREPEMLKRWEETSLYARLIESRKEARPWVLHDGPPYANGRVHLGTALNKILKDFAVRSRSMMGFRTPYVPGWDCHGMPIEFKVSRDLGEKARSMPKIELRRICRAEADKWIDLQRKDFMRLGCIGDWFKPYITMDPAYDAAEIGVLRKLVAAGYIYRGMRPVHWCFADRTALAEAEVEYREHSSPSIYVAFRINGNAGDAAKLAAEASEGAELAAAQAAGRLYAVIWTTTPWTLPANLGISLNETFDYVALRSGDKYYIVAARLAEATAQACGMAVEKHVPIDREALKALDGKDIFVHPFANRDGRLMFGDHVTADAGTGLVHTAPGHGYEDFVVGTQYGLKPFTPVDTRGMFTADGGEWAGQNVFKANDSIVAKLREIGALLHAEKLSHSYPHCWRCKNPLIFLATEQWFMSIDHENLRSRMIAEIDGCTWVPQWSRDRIRNMTETRPDWCLSRQRVWGVPIPALKCAGCGHVGLYDEVMRTAERIFETEGSDAWFARPASDFATPGLKCEKCGGESSFEKEEDVLDVWFDSGSSQAAVMGKRTELTWPADAYLEAVEQARGWFGSSLACAVAERGHAPFRTVISHGLTVDEQGRKMSKSLGNSEDAAAAVNRMGADVLRLVYAFLDYTTEIALGDTIYTSVSEAYRKIRNTFRYMLGNLYDFDPARDLVAPAEMIEFDRFIMARMERLKTKVREAYEAYNFQPACHDILNFMVVDLSSLYIDVARDRLYCSAANSRERRSAQTALYLMLDTLVRMLAPLIPFTADEVYSHMPGKAGDSVHLLTLREADSSFADTELESRWDKLIALRKHVLGALENLRASGDIGAPLEASVEIFLPDHWPGDRQVLTDGSLDEILKDSEELKSLFIVSNARIVRGAEADKFVQSEEPTRRGSVVSLIENPRSMIKAQRAPGKKCQRCWMYFEGEGDLDPRCRAVVQG
jgi:isoleucyl-tRNA synthetase